MTGWLGRRSLGTPFVNNVHFYKRWLEISEMSPAEKRVPQPAWGCEDVNLSPAVVWNGTNAINKLCLTTGQGDSHKQDLSVKGENGIHLHVPGSSFTAP